MTPADLYDRLRGILEKVAETAVDEQTDFAERLSLVEAALGLKPSYVAFLDGRDRQGAFDGVEALLPAGVACGTVRAEVHHVYRPFRIDDAALRSVVEERAGYAQDVFWASRDPELASLYISTAPASVPDDRLLGYPPCCAAWHYDVFFARGVEAFCAVAACENQAEMSAFLSEGWEPQSGFYLPDPFFLASILRSNWRFPFIDHIACPGCVGAEEGLSAVMNAARSDLGRKVDPSLHARVASWSAAQEPRWRDILDRRNYIAEGYARRVCDSVRGTDVYARHARHLAKAITG